MKMRDQFDNKMQGHGGTAPDGTSLVLHAAAQVMFDCLDRLDDREPLPTFAVQCRSHRTGDAINEVLHAQHGRSVSNIFSVKVGKIGGDDTESVILFACLPNDPELKKK